MSVKWKRGALRGQFTATAGIFRLGAHGGPGNWGARGEGHVVTRAATLRGAQQQIEGELLAALQSAIEDLTGKESA